MTRETAQNDEPPVVLSVSEGPVSPVLFVMSERRKADSSLTLRMTREADSSLTLKMTRKAVPNNGRRDRCPHRPGGVVCALPTPSVSFADSSPVKGELYFVGRGLPDAPMHHVILWGATTPARQTTLA